MLGPFLNLDADNTVNGSIDLSGKVIANLIMNDLKGLLNKYKLKIEQCPLKPEVIGFLGRSIASNNLTKKQAKALMAKWFEENLKNGEEKNSNNNDNDHGNND
jgi:Asp-tRNA(Asn)/Glu-tRNA(Gln) amidotransferase B subunit